MTSGFLKIPALAVFLAAGIQSATASIVTLSSPDNKWRLSSDEFGASGEAVGGSFAARDFGAGLTGYTWASSVLFSDGVNRQALSSDTGAFGFGGLSAPIGGGSLISDTTAGNMRTSIFNVPGFAGIQVRLTQTVTNGGITQQYLISNSGASAVSLSAISFHDVDLDGGTFLNNIIASPGGTLKVSESGRDVYFSPSPLGYVGFLAGYVDNGGITGNLDAIAYKNFGIPIANLNQFRDVKTGAPTTNMDANADGISDAPGDVGYLFQNNVTIPAGGSVSLGYGQLSTVPEPSAALLGLFALGLTARRRR